MPTIRFRPVLIALLLPLALLAGCEDYPKDPEDTLRDVTGGTMMVGLVERPPWVRLDGNGEPEGVEVDLVRGLARELDSRIVWVRHGESNVLEALERGALDLVVGGLTTASPWSAHLAFTAPYYEERLVVAAPAADERRSLEGLPVLVDPGTVEAALVRAGDGEPVADAGGGVVRYAAKPEWRMDPSEHAVLELETRRHVFAVEKGENAFLIRVERYLDAHADEIPRRLREAAP